MDKNFDITKNYITIQGWMVTELELKGNELLIYAIIYGFCQQEGHPFYGSLDYMATWTNSTRQGVIKAINKLIEKGLIRKEEIKGYSNKYYITSTTKVEEPIVEQSLLVNKVNNTSKQSLQGGLNKVNRGSKQSLQNNIEYNIDIYNNIISYFNKVCKTNYSLTKDIEKLIKDKLKQGYTENDFKKVIDYKYDCWFNHAFTLKSGFNSQSNIKPKIFFGNKFEDYLQEAENQVTRRNESICCEDCDEELLKGEAF